MQEVQYRGEPVDYQITLEAYRPAWILALDMPARVARARGLAQLRLPARVAARSPKCRRSACARTRSSSGTELPVSLRRKGTQLPPRATRAAVPWPRAAARHGSDPVAITRDC